MAPSKKQTYVALLRGVNVGGRNKLTSAALKEAFERAGFEDVRTYLQSGNVVFTASAAAPQIAAGMQQELGVPVLLRSAGELRAIVARHPFGAPEDFRGSGVLVVFLDDALPPAAKTKLETLRAPEERLLFGERELFGWFPNGMGRSKLGEALHAKSLGVTCTARNWNTVAALAEMVGG